MNPKITIIGAGLVGSLWAVLLRKRNFQVEVFEKRSDIRLDQKASGRSINLILTSRGLHALEMAGLKAEALKFCAPVYGRMMHSKTSELTYQAYGANGEHNFSVSRRDLNLFLLNEAEKAGAKINFNESLDQIDFKNKKFKMNSGLSRGYELLFGTDGAGSLVRKNLVRQMPDQYVESSEWLSADYKELFLPQPNPLDKKSLHIWPRGDHMMMALANLDGSFTMTVYLQKKAFEQIKTQLDIKNLFQTEFPDSIDLMPDYLKDFEMNPQGALGTIRCNNWVFEDSVALMGDAAHAIVPFFGQGMNSGFEDCTQFLKILDQNHGNFKKTLEVYNQTQPQNANAIADMALENWVEMSEKVADPKFLMRKKAEGMVEKKFPEIFKSRYGMVTYTLIPYHLVQKAGRVQDQIFSELCKDLDSVENLSLDQASKLLDSHYKPFLHQYGLL
jgi:kynurenine 3-monooxygenase